MNLGCVQLFLIFPPSNLEGPGRIHQLGRAMLVRLLARSALRRAGDEHTRVNLQDAIVAPNNLLPPFFNRNL
jgi:hypothetical protein